MSNLKRTKIVRKEGEKAPVAKAGRSVAGIVLAQARPREGGTDWVKAAHHRGVNVLLVKYADKRTGNVVVERLVDGTGFTKKNLAGTLGISMDAMYRADRVNSPTTQVRMREMLEILGRIADWAGGEAQAMAWYRGQPIPAFGGRTAESLVKSNQAGPLRDYLDHMAMGGFA
ncbi:MAG: antitoxin Xre/MbcA/ParS toxin-binding domain-containing protein [Metallibacterium scheffleri]